MYRSWYQDRKAYCTTLFETFWHNLNRVQTTSTRLEGLYVAYRLHVLNQTSL